MTTLDVSSRARIALSEPQGTIRGVMTDAPYITGEDLPPAVVNILEAICQGFRLGHGPATIELQFQDGGFQAAYLKGRISLGRLLEFQASFDDAMHALENRPAPPDRT